jgi:hypothetical protein
MNKELYPAKTIRSRQEAERRRRNEVLAKLAEYRELALLKSGQRELRAFCSRGSLMSYNPVPTISTK